MKTIGVVGSGQIGPDIALYFAKTLPGTRIVIHDIAQAALDAGRAKAQKKIDKGVETGAFKPDQAKQMSAAMEFTTDPAALAGADFVLEAATEDLQIKRKIFADLGTRCPNAILASNSSHLEPEVIFEGVANPGRTLVIHYFFPAERNPLVEVVPGKQTEPHVADFCMKFYESIGKAPIRVGSRYGYAIDPVFEGLFLASLLLAEQGVGTHKEIDAVAQKALGLGVGPFTAMNLTGGTPLTRIGLGHYHEKIMPWFRVPETMKTRTEPWPTAGRDEKVDVAPEKFEKISRALLGAYFGLVAEVLESGITNIGDLEMGVELGLVMKAPFELMNSLGQPKVLELVETYAKENPGFKVADGLRMPQAWTIPYVTQRMAGDVAVVTIRRPKTLNALNREIYHQIRKTFDHLANDAAVRAVVLTGFGTKAFVSGAEIGMLAAVKSPEEGAALSWESQEAQFSVENLGKPVVCAMNGLALGGGSELAMACTARIARKGLSICFGQPEVKLGIIPGAGATQRLPRIIGHEKAWEILRTARNVKGDEAEKLGYIREQVDGDVVERGIALARELVQRPPKPIEKGPFPAPANLPDVDLGHLSRKVDSILTKAIVEGNARDLEQGLWLESRCFGEVCGTKDMRIGLENFLKTNLKEPAKFVNA
jgi:enoyl-CoA hydratase / 3-hydroxyacyl-CoA dehydrogenase